MKKVAMRSVAALILAAFLTAGLGLFIYQYITKGESWATYYANSHITSAVGGSSVTVTDRNGVVLLSGSGADRTYNGDLTVRKSTLHVLGDLEGNIYSPAMRAYNTVVAGFDPVGGVKKGGDNMTLSLDSGACAAALAALGDRHGAIGVYNYKTGELLCEVTTPTYDPLDPPDLSNGEAGYEGIYVNRFLGSTYTPGSVFKLVTAAAAIDNIRDIDTRTFTCEGSMTLSGQKITCTHAHGTVDFKTALAKSCNCAFGQIAAELGAEKLQQYVEKTGLCASLEFQGVATAKGQFDLGQANTGDLAWAGIGQYSTLVNPCSMMVLMGTIANGGRQQFPSLVMGENGELGGQLLSYSTASLLKEMMANDVKQTYGQDNFPGLSLCAKSGTAENGSSNPHAWFAGFLDDEAHPYAFVVVAENSGSGSEVAGSIANQVLQYMVSH